MSNEHIRAELARLLIEIHRLNREIAHYRSQIQQFSFDGLISSEPAMVVLYPQS